MTILVTGVARGILLAGEVDQAIGRAYLLVNDEPVTQCDDFNAIVAELGVRPPRWHGPYGVALALGATAEMVGHLTRRKQSPPLMRFGLKQRAGENGLTRGRARVGIHSSDQPNRGRAPGLCLVSSITSRAGYIRCFRGASKMEILITGGNGFLGRHLVPVLQQRGDRVRVLALPTEDTTWLEQRGVAVIRGDICAPGVLKAPLRGVDSVIHLAAMIGAWRPMQDYYAVNVLGTEHVCRAALAAGVRRFIHISSAMVYNMAIGRPVTEEDPLNPLDEPYSLTKAQGDKLVQQMIAQDHLPAVIVRPGTLFGPGDHLNFGRIVERLRAGKAMLVGSGNNAVPLVYVSDMVQGLLLALDHQQAAGQVYNIGNDQPLTQGQFLAAIAQELGMAPPRIHVPYAPLYVVASAAERIATASGSRIPPVVTRHGVKLYGADNRLSIEKARRELGYAPRVPLREGVRLTAAWYQHRDSWTWENMPISVSGTPTR